jgi:hypothetical protein
MLPLATWNARTRLVRPRARTHAWVLGCLFLMFPFAANAITIPLDIELDTGMTGDFVSIEITPNGDQALDFVITLNTDLLGSDADLNVLYFNIDGAVPDLDDLGIELTNAPFTEYRLTAARGVRGGAGSTFDYSIHFGNGSGSHGNGVLQVASFTLTGLTLESMAESSFAAGGSIEIDLAAHVQGTNLTRGANSETLGGSFPAVPEPSTGLLALFGLLLLGARRHIRSH